jgi:hypothetical protein
MIIDGKIVDLNSISYEELDQLQANLENKQEEIRNQIDEILNEE